jgi:hypothetical protein
MSGFGPLLQKLTMEGQLLWKRFPINWEKKDWKDWPHREAYEAFLGSNSQSYWLLVLEDGSAVLVIGKHRSESRVVIQEDRLDQLLLLVRRQIAKTQRAMILRQAKESRNGEDSEGGIVSAALAALDQLAGVPR